MTKLGERIREFGEKRYESVKDFAKSMKMAPSNLQKYMNGDLKPGADILLRISELGCDLNWLVAGDEDVKQTQADIKGLNEAVKMLDRARESIESLYPSDKRPVRPQSRLNSEVVEIPFSEEAIAAGAPSPVSGNHSDKTLFISRNLLKHPEKSYAVRVIGDSMSKSGIADGDIVIIDRAIEAKSDHIAAVAVDGQLTLKRVKMRGNETFLVPESHSNHHKEIQLTGEMDVNWQGVAIQVIHEF